MGQVQHKPLSLGYGLLHKARSSGAVPKEVSALVKDQTERHASSYQSLFGASENTSLFLPVKGKYTLPPWLSLIHNARPFVGKLNIKRNAFRESGLHNVKTPECAHGLGSADWLMHCVGVKSTSEKYLNHVLVDYNLSAREVAWLSIIRLSLDMYLHDVVEDNRKHNPKITAGYVSREVLSRVLEKPYDAMLRPILTADIKAFTDKPGLEGDQRLAAQKIPPQREYELLCSLGVIDEKTVGTGPIGTGKFVDKAQQNGTDFLVAETGQCSFFKSAEHFERHIAPRIDIVSSLHVPDSYKTLYLETIDRTLFRLRNPFPAPIPTVEARMIIHFELMRFQSVLSGKPHKPVKPKFYSLPVTSGLAGRSPTP